MIGSTAKIYAQKGTGGARHSSRKAPIFVGGGNAHGPKGAVYKVNKINKKISDENKTAFLSLGYIPNPSTAYENIFCLNPATVIEIEKGTIIKEKKYWNLNRNDEKYNKINNNYLDDFHNKLISSIKNRLHSDAPKCLFLSSGIDSTLIASIIAKEIKEKIQCITIGFNNFSSIDELQNSLKIAKYLRLPQKRINLKISSKEITSRNLLKMYGQPNDNLTIIPVTKMTEVAKKLNFKVFSYFYINT